MEILVSLLAVAVAASCLVTLLVRGFQERRNKSALVTTHDAHRQTHPGQELERE